jgi:hypothetical protein
MRNMQGGRIGRWKLNEFSIDDFRFLIEETRMNTDFGGFEMYSLTLKYHQETDQFEVEFHGKAASYCHAFPMAPCSKEPELNSGRWFILVFAVWSGPDVMSVDTVLSTAERVNGDIQFGIRPFNEYAEMKAWCPEAKGSHPGPSPIWLLFQEGRVIYEFRGLRNETQVLEMIRSQFHTEVASQENVADACSSSLQSG